MASVMVFAIDPLLAVPLMGRIAPVRLLAIFAGLSQLLAAVAGIAGDIWAPRLAAAAAHGCLSLLVMAIIRGAVPTGMLGCVSGRASINTAMLKPAACFAVALAFVIVASRPSDGVATGPVILY